MAEGPKTFRMWRPLIPRLADRFTVVAPDLPGIGDSDIPSDGLNMARAGARIHGLVQGLGIEKAVVVGHDIGLMVAYAYAAQFPAGRDACVRAGPTSSRFSRPPRISLASHGPG